MRFSYAEAMCDPQQYLPLARAAEEAGYDGYIVPDSIAYPEVSDSKYPYTPDGSREFLEDKPFIDPFSLVPAMAAVTSRIRFITSVLKLPIRHPVLVAKQATSVAVMSNNRFVMGVGSSPWPDDYRICDAAWKGRGRRMDEMLQIIRGLCDGGFYQFKGEFYDLESIKLCPVPTEKLPILIGGHSEPALRRAAKYADGWIHAGGDVEELETCLKRLKELRDEHGTADREFEVHVISMDAYKLDGIARLEELGVTDVVVGFRYAYETDTMPMEHKLAALQKYGEKIIARYRG